MAWRSAGDDTVPIHLSALDAVAPGAVLADVAVPPSGGDPGAALARLDPFVHPAERDLAARLGTARAAEFLAGRAALRAAMRRVAPSHAGQPVLRTPRGAPVLPQGVTGSISHKRTRALAMALAAPATHVGLDLEERPQAPPDPSRDIAGRVLTDAERSALDGLEPRDRHEAVLLRFAIKEAVYKAIDPLVGRYVAFGEVALELSDDGNATVRLPAGDLALRDVAVRARWWMDDTHLMAAVATVPR